MTLEIIQRNIDNRIKRMLNENEDISKISDRLKITMKNFEDLLGEYPFSARSDMMEKYISCSKKRIKDIDKILGKN